MVIQDVRSEVDNKRFLKMFSNLKVNGQTFRRPCKSLLLGTTDGRWLLPG